MNIYVYSLIKKNLNLNQENIPEWHEKQPMVYPSSIEQNVYTPKLVEVKTWLTSVGNGQKVFDKDNVFGVPVFSVKTDREVSFVADKNINYPKWDRDSDGNIISSPDDAYWEIQELYPSNVFNVNKGEWTALSPGIFIEENPTTIPKQYVSSMYESYYVFDSMGATSSSQNKHYKWHKKHDYTDIIYTKLSFEEIQDQIVNQETAVDVYTDEPCQILSTKKVSSARTGYPWSGNYQYGHEFFKGTIYTDSYDGNLYRCIQSYTIQSILDALSPARDSTHWARYYAPEDSEHSHIYPYKTLDATIYTASPEQDIVRYRNMVYGCVTTHTATNVPPDDDTVNWAPYADYLEFSFEGMCSNHLQILWEENNDAAGTLKLEVPYTKENKELFQRGRFIMIPDSEKAMIIEATKTTYDYENGRTLLVSGRSLESILDRRITFPGAYLDTEASQNRGGLYTGINSLIKRLFVTPEDSKYVNALGEILYDYPERRVPNFSVLDPDPADIRARGATINATYLNKNLYDVIKDICQKNALSYEIVPRKKQQRIVIDRNDQMIDTTEFEFKLYGGNDHSYDRNDPNVPLIVFSKGYGTLESLEITRDDTEYKNFAFTSKEKKKQSSYIRLSDTNIERINGYKDRFEVEGTWGSATLAKLHKTIRYAYQISPNNTKIALYAIARAIVKAAYSVSSGTISNYTEATEGILGNGTHYFSCTIKTSSGNNIDLYIREVGMDWGIGQGSWVDFLLSTSYEWLTPEVLRQVINNGDYGILDGSIKSIVSEIVSFIDQFTSAKSTTVYLVGTSPSIAFGLDRREVYAEYKDDSKEWNAATMAQWMATGDESLVTNTNDNDETDAETITKLNRSAASALAQYSQKVEIDAEVSENSQYVYGVDYKLGDIVQLDDGEGMSTKAIVSAYVISEDETGYKKYPKFSIFKEIPERFNPLRDLTERKFLDDTGINPVVNPGDIQYAVNQDSSAFFKFGQFEYTLVRSDPGDSVYNAESIWRVIPKVPFVPTYFMLYADVEASKLTNSTELYNKSINSVPDPLHPRVLAGYPTIVQQNHYDSSEITNFLWTEYDIECSYEDLNNIDIPEEDKEIYIFGESDYYGDRKRNVNGISIIRDDNYPLIKSVPTVHWRKRLPKAVYAWERSEHPREMDTEDLRPLSWLSLQGPDGPEIDISQIYEGEIFFVYPYTNDSVQRDYVIAKVVYPPNRSPKLTIVSEGSNPEYKIAWESAPTDIYNIYLTAKKRYTSGWFSINQSPWVRDTSLDHYTGKIVVATSGPFNFWQGDIVQRTNAIPAWVNRNAEPYSSSFLKLPSDEGSVIIPVDGNIYAVMPDNVSNFSGKYYRYDGTKLRYTEVTYQYYEDAYEYVDAKLDYAGDFLTIDKNKMLKIRYNILREIDGELKSVTEITPEGGETMTFVFDAQSVYDNIRRNDYIKHCAFGGIVSDIDKVVHTVDDISVGTDVGRGLTVRQASIYGVPVTVTRKNVLDIHGDYRELKETYSYDYNPSDQYCLRSYKPVADMEFSETGQGYNDKRYGFYDSLNGSYISLYASNPEQGTYVRNGGGIYDE